MDRYNANLHILKHLHFRKALHNNFNDLIISDTFRLLALSMISIFIPIFLYSKMNVGAWGIGLFELLSFVLSIIFHYTFVPLTGHFGVKKIMTLSYLLNSVACLLLYFGAQLNFALGAFGFILLIALFDSLPTALYWSAHHIYFLQSTKSENEGEKLGLLQSIPLIISIAGPFIGGILITNYSFREVFLFSTLLLIVASFSLFFTDDIKAEIKVSWRKTIDTNNFKKNTVFFLHGLGYCATSYIWPLLLFVSSISLIGMGFFYFISNIINATIGYFGGKSADKNGSEKILKIGAIGHSFSIIFRALSSTAIFMATFQSMGGFFGGLMHIAIDASFYKNAHDDIGNAIMNREFYMHLGRIFTIMIFLMALVLFDFKIALIFTLIMAGLGTFLLLLIVNSKCSFMNSSALADIDVNKQKGLV